MNKIYQAAQALPGHWHKGSASDGQGNYCGIGHLWNVCGLTDDRGYLDKDVPELVHNMQMLMDKAANEQFPERANGAFFSFNDHIETTEDEVIAVLEKAAVRFDEIV